LAASWGTAWATWGVPPPVALRAELIERYGEAHRHYHTLQHLRECLEQFSALRAIAQCAGEVELALWFHDAVYDPRREDNEVRSAHWAHRELEARGVATEVAIVSGLAPGKFANTLIVGKSTWGSGATGRNRKATAPASRIASEMSEVATGRRMNGAEKLEVKFTGCPLTSYFRRLRAGKES